MRLIALAMGLIFLPLLLISQNFSVDHVDYPFGGRPSHFIAAPDGTLYCQVYDVALYSSTDDGETWQPVYPEREAGHYVPRTGANTVVVSISGDSWLMPADGNRYEFYGALDARYAYDATAFGETLVIATDNGVGISRDRGYTWERSGEQDVYSLEVEYVAGYLYSVQTGNTTGTDRHVRIARSLDSGSLWQMLELPLEFRTPMTAPDPSTGEFLLHFADQGLYRWNIGEDVLSPVDTVRRRIGDVSVSPDGEIVLQIGDSIFFYSPDGERVGDLLLDGPLRNPRDIAYTPQGALLLGSQGKGVFRSSDDGHSWVQVGVPSGTYFYGASILPNGDVLTSTTGADLYRISNPTRPEGWTLLNSDGRAFEWIDAGEREEWLAYASDSLFRSTDSGGSWHGIRVDSVDALRQSPDGSLIVLVGGEVRRSTDSGASWETVHRVSWLGGMIETAPNGDLWIGVHNALLRSRDSGISWQEWSIPSLGFSQSSPSAIGFTPEGAILVQLIGFQHQMMRSTDQGQSWGRVNARPCDLGGTRIYGLAETFTLTFGWCGLHYSTDDGLTWHHVPEFPERLTRTLAVETDHGILAFTEEGLYVIRQSSGVRATLELQRIDFK